MAWNSSIPEQLRSPVFRRNVGPLIHPAASSPLHARQLLHPRDVGRRDALRIARMDELDVDQRLRDGRAERGGKRRSLGVREWRLASVGLDEGSDQSGIQ